MRWMLLMLCVAPLGAQVNFQAEVRPILAKRCWACHGPDEHGRQAGVRLDVREAATRNNAIVPGASAKSRVVARVTHATAADAAERAAIDGCGSGCAEAVD